MSWERMLSRFSFWLVESRLPQSYLVYPLEVFLEMIQKQLFKIIDVLEGPDHHSRNTLLVRNGRWGTCVSCPRIDGEVFPEKCEYTKRYDHNLEVNPDTLLLVAQLKS